MIRLSQKKGGVALSYTQMVLNVLVKFVYTPFLLRALGQNEYGLFSLTMSIVGYLAILDMGFGSTVTRYAVKYKAEGDRDKLYELYSTLSVVYIIIGFIALIVCFILSYYTESMFGSTMTEVEVHKLKVMILLCGVNLLFTFPLQISASVVAAHERFIFKNTIVLLRTILQPIILVALLYMMEIKSIGAILVVTAFNFLNYFVYYVYSVKSLEFKFSLKKFTPRMIPTLLSFSGWMFALMIFEHLQYNSGQFILGMFQSTSIIAVWGIALIFILNFRSLSTAITNVFLPSFLSLTYNHEREKMKDAIRKMVRLQSLVLYLILFNFILFGYKFIHYWAGGEYDDAYHCALVVMIPMSFSLILDFSYLYQFATKQLKYRAMTFFCGLIASFFFFYFTLGINLISFSYMMATSILLGQVLAVIIYIMKNIDLQLNNIFLNLVKDLFAPIIFTIAYYVLLNRVSNTSFSVLNTIICFLLYNIVIFVVLWLFSFDNSEKASFKNLLR